MNDIILPNHDGDDPLLHIRRGKGAFTGSPRDLLFVLFWHRRKVVGFFILAALLTVLAVLALPNTYRSESKLLVKLGGQAVTPDPGATLGGPIVQPVMYWEVQMKTELEVLKSRQIAMSVVDQIGAGRILRMGDVGQISQEDPLYRQALLALQQNLSLEVVPDSSILQIAYESGDGRLARDITQAYVDRYLSLRIHVHESQASADFLQGEREETIRKVQEVESQIRKIKDESGIADIGEQRQILQQRIGAMRSDVAGIRAEGITAQAEVNAIEKRLQNTPVRTLGPALYQDMVGRIESARVTASVSEAKVKAIETEIGVAESELKKVNDVELTIKQLLRAANLREDALKLIAQASDRATLLAAFQGEKLNNVSLVQPATLPLKPVAPNRLMLLMMGMFVAASGAVGLGIASETLSRTTKRPEDIDRISALPSVSVPVVDAHGFMGNGMFSTNGSSRLSRLLGGRANEQAVVVTRAAGTASTTLIRAGATGMTDIRPVRRWSPQLLQAAHGIIDGLLFDAIRQAKHESAFVTGLISCRPGQGASTMSAYVASAIADRLEASLPLHPDDRVLLVDADLAEPSLHRLMSIDDTPGLGDWLAIGHIDAPSITEYAHATNHGRLSVMPSGRSSTLTRMLDRMDLLIDEATRHYRHVVVDLPPVSSTPTALRLAAKCNAVLLVVECGNLHQEVVRRSVRALQAAGANVSGVVLNKRRFPIPDWLYERAS